MKNNKSISYIYLFICVTIIFLGFVLRVYDLAEKSLWFDESVEYWAALSPLPSILSTVKVALQDPPLYTVLLHFWIKVAGHNEFSVRFLSLVFSMGGILGVIVLSKEALGKKESLISGLLIAVSVPDIRFAQEAGQYALMVFLLSWNLVFLYLLTKENAWKWSVLWGISGIIAIYSYYGVVFTIGATTFVCLVYIVVKQKWDRLLKLVVGGGIYSISTLPLVLWWLPSQMFRGPTTTAFQFLVKSYSEELLIFLNQIKAFVMFQFMGYQPNGWPWLGVPEYVIWLPAVFLFVVGIMKYKINLPVVWFMVGLLIYYLAGRWGAFPFGGRYSLILSPLFWVCLAAGNVGLFSLRTTPLFLRNTLAIVLLGWIILISFISPVEPQEDLRSVTRFWLSLRQPSEVTYVYYGAVPGFRYQLNLAGFSEIVPSLWYQQCWRGEKTHYCSKDNISYGRWIRSLDAEQKKRSIIETIGSSPDRLWIIFSHTSPEEEKTILVAFDDTYNILKSYSAENSQALLLERK